MTVSLKHILVIRLSAMGDVAMTVPVLRAFIMQNPEVKVTILTRSFFSPFFQGLSNVSILNVDVNGEHKGFLGLIKLSREIKKLQIDAVADLHNVLRSKILKIFLKGIPFKQIDKGRAEKKELVSGKTFRQLKSTHQRYVDVFLGLGYKIDLTESKFPQPKTLSKSSLEIVGKKTEKWIGIAPFATYQSKMYPLHLMNNVIKELSKTYKVLLFGGGKREIEILNSIEAKVTNTINVAGKTTLGNELEIISSLDAMLSMDSGNAHMAAMLGVKVITIWGVTHPYAGFYPFGQPDDYALLSNRKKFPKIPTSIYGNKYPDSYVDVSKTISPKVVINKIKSII